MFLGFLLGVLKFFGLALGASLAWFLFGVITAHIRGDAVTIHYNKGTFTAGIVISLAYHLIKWCI